MQLPERSGQNNFEITALRLLKGTGSVDGSPADLYCPFRSLPVNAPLRSLRYRHLHKMGRGTAAVLKNGTTRGRARDVLGRRQTREGAR